MADRRSTRATLRDKFELEKFRSRAVKNVSEMKPSPSNFDQKQKSTETEGIVKHMKHLPSYLERGNPNQDQALSFGVMDWGRLEKWQNQHYKHGLVKNIKESPCSSYSSLFSADGSSPRFSRDQSRSPARQKAHRVTLRSHFKDSPNQDFTCVQKSQYFQNDSKQSCLKGKLKIQDESVNNNNSSNVPTFQYEAINVKNSQSELAFSRNKTPERKSLTNSPKKTPERKSLTSSPKRSGLISRSVSPLRRLSFGFKSATERPDSPVSQSSNKDSNRSSSPLRRLLDPIFSSKETGHEDLRTKAKVKLDFEKEIRVEDGSSSSSSSSRKQALFQTTVKNERLLFTFAVENDAEILAATVTNNNKNSLYTFFTVHEVKNKNISWLTYGNKSKDNSYVPNITAQMKVSVSGSDRDTQEYVLFSVNPNVHPQEELEAIVVKLSRKSNGEGNHTVILPGGSHGVPVKAQPSPLVDRWRSGGVCDCGGWDVGCILRTLSNQVPPNGSRFELYSQGEFQNKRPVFSLSPLKEGIFSIDYNSSLSPLQTFSICISYVESRKLTQHAQLKTHSPQQVPRMYTPIPRIKRGATGKVTSL
ncbi:uncharacterized protein LOC143542116 isoform X2 [Bidens hawaiensis]|uniref:uncharacterized protein LOC143542116 isoform X2 n=1 Tax=Bidens hawaiensis TaxID=980011 RepID=UPI00404AB655